MLSSCDWRCDVGLRDMEHFIDSETGHLHGQEKAPSKIVPKPRLQRPQTNVRWKRVQSLPNKMLQPQIVPTKDVVYVGGGLGNTSTLSMCAFAYKIAEDAWKTLPETPTALFGMCSFRNSLITVGGVCEDGITGKVYRLNEAKERWEEFLPAMPTQRFSLSVFSADSVLIACGGGKWGDGEDTPSPCSVVEVYRHKRKAWFSASNLPRPSAAMSSTVIGGVCYLLGDTESRHGYGAMYAKITDLASSKGDSHLNSGKDDPSTLRLDWHHLPPPPVANTSIVATRSYLLAIGGHTERGTVTGVHIYIKESQEWWQLAHGDLPQGLEGCGLAVLDTTGKVMVVGGEDSAGMFTNGVFIGNLL